MSALQDYDLHNPVDAQQTGLRRGLTSYGDPYFSLFLRKVFVKAAGYSEDALSRPLIGIINTHSGFNPCHAHVPQLIEAAKRGIHLAGGLAIDFPTISLHESFSSPTSMFLRNLMSMDTEEMIRAQSVPAHSISLPPSALPAYARDLSPEEHRALEAHFGMTPLPDSQEHFHGETGEAT